MHGLRPSGFAGVLACSSICSRRSIVAKACTIRGHDDLSTPSDAATTSGIPHFKYSWQDARFEWHTVIWLCSPVLALGSCRALHADLIVQCWFGCPLLLKFEKWHLQVVVIHRESNHLTIQACGCIICEFASCLSRGFVCLKYGWSATSWSNVHDLY